MTQRVTADPVSAFAVALSAEMAHGDRETKLRREVRRFLAETLPADYRPGLGLAAAHDPSFSKSLAARGWVGMSIPREFGGHGKDHLTRFIVTEELLAAGAPIGAHWIADRQMAPSIAHYGSAEQKRRLLPAIARGECYFSIGMSEPDSGSDLASIRTSAQRAGSGWKLNGTKVWTTNAHRNHFVMVLARTASHADRHQGLSQFIVDLATPGVQVSPIRTQDGAHHINEVAFVDVAVPSTMLLGTEGEGWAQVTSELAFERSGPDRYLSTFPVLDCFVRERLAAHPAPDVCRALGALIAAIRSIRQVCIDIARQLDSGAAPAAQAAMAKDMGTMFEHDSLNALRLLDQIDDTTEREGHFASLLAEATLSAPSFTLRGGTTEILRGIAARALMS